MQIRKLTSRLLGVPMPLETLGNNSNLLGGKSLQKDWISGFIDAEGCFNISLSKHPKAKVGYKVQLKMHVTQHIRSVNVLYAMKEFFCCGTMVVHNKLADRMRYQITAIAEIKNALNQIWNEGRK